MAAAFHRAPPRVAACAVAHWLRCLLARVFRSLFSNSAVTGVREAATSSTPTPVLTPALPTSTWPCMASITRALSALRLGCAAATDQELTLKYWYDCHDAAVGKVQPGACLGSHARDLHTALAWPRVQGCLACLKLVTTLQLHRFRCSFMTGQLQLVSGGGGQRRGRGIPAEPA